MSEAKDEAKNEVKDEAKDEAKDEVKSEAKDEAKSEATADRKVEEFAEHKIEIDGWPVNLVSYKIGDTFYCKADNVSPGARLARTKGTTREEVESAAIARAKELLARTRRREI